MKRRNASAISRGVTKKRRTEDAKIARIAASVYAKKERQESELKYYDKEQVNNTISTSGTIFTLTDVSVGTAGNNRIGNKIRPKGLNLRFEFTANSSATYNSFRMIVFKMNSGVPGVSNILDSTASAAYRHLSQISIDNSKRFVILADKTVTVSDTANLDIPAVVNDKLYIKLGGTIEYTSAGGNEMNNIYMCVISDSAVNFPEFSYTSRFRFTDS